jgi:hypothetical protein
MRSNVEQTPEPNSVVSQGSIWDAIKAARAQREAPEHTPPAEMIAPNISPYRSTEEPRRAGALVVRHRAKLHAPLT